MIFPCLRTLGGDHTIPRVQLTVPMLAPDFQQDQINCGQRTLALRREIFALIAKDAIERVDQRIQQGGFSSLYFLIPKKDAGFRLILNLRGLNQFLKVLPFHMLRTAEVLQAITPGDWFTSIDLKDAYFHISMRGFH